MNRLPAELQMTIAENVEDEQDLLNLRFVNRVLSEGAAHVLFRHLKYSVGPLGFMSLARIAESRYALCPRSLRLQAPELRGNGLLNVDAKPLTLSFFRRTFAALRRLRNIVDIKILLDSDLADLRRLPGDKTQVMFWLLVHTICSAKTALSRYVHVHLEIRHHMTIMDDVIWPAPGQWNYQRWVSRLVGFTMDTKYLCRCLCHQVCLADHFALPNDRLQRFDISANESS